MTNTLNELKSRLPFKDCRDIHFNPADLACTPAYVVDTDLVKANLKLLDFVRQQTGAKILLAQKAFANFPLYPLLSRYLDGTTASGLYEARLGHDYFPGEVHVFSPAFKKEDMAEVCDLADTIVFNSLNQWRKHRAAVTGHPRSREISCGLRVNPRHSTQGGGLYDPCAPLSRFGVTADQLAQNGLPEGIEGLHFHTLCEQGLDALAETLAVFEKDFGPYLEQIKWLNLGGGHHITRRDYDVAGLLNILCRLRDRYGLQVYLEPGEAVVLNAGFLVSEVMEIVHNEGDIAILDASAECHMPDVLAMPYRPEIEGGGPAGERAHTYRLSSCTCLAGDITGDYSFDRPLKEGDRLIFYDMALYTMVKNNTFNGMPLPDIVTHSQAEGLKLLKTFSYEDFKSRLG